MLNRLGKHSLVALDFIKTRINRSNWKSHGFPVDPCGISLNVVAHIMPRSVSSYRCMCRKYKNKGQPTDLQYKLTSNGFKGK